MKYLLIVLTLIGTVAFGQSSLDSMAIDTTSIDPEHYDYYSGDGEEKDAQADADSMKITNRKFEDGKVESLRSDSDLQYEKAPMVAESLWRRFYDFIASIFRQLFKAVGTSFGQWFWYVLGLVMLIALILALLKVDAFRLFYGNPPISKTGTTMFDENIHEMNFDTLIQDAAREQDYRKGIRLVFLYALRMLSDRHLISWEQGKTNHDYIAEVKSPELKNGLSELSYYFDYVWYGNFKVSQEHFNKVQGTFKNWRSNLK